MIPVGYLDYCITEVPDIFEYPDVEWVFEWQREPRRAGFDVADEGSDDSSLVIRQGPVVIHVSKFGSDVETSCEEVYRLCKEFNVTALWYDSIGIGTGVRDRFKYRMPCRTVIPINFGASVTGKRTKFDDKQYNEEVFFRRNAQLGWNLHMRVEQSRLNAINSSIEVDPRRQLYVLPEILDSQLKGEFTQPVWATNMTGHMRVNKKPLGKSKSPDSYDALVLAFAHDSRQGLRSGGRHLITNGTELEPKMQKVLNREREVAA